MKSSGAPMTHLARAEPPNEGRLRVWARSAFAASLVAVLVALGIANIVQRATWHDVEDGVFWADRAEGVVAAEIAPDSPAAIAGVERGDVLLAVNGSPIETRADVIDVRASRSGRHAARVYAGPPRNTPGARCVARSRSAPQVDVLRARRRRPLHAARRRARCALRRPRDQATLHFFWLCVAFFGEFTFSFNGPFDRLDWIFYWGDAMAIGAPAAAAAALHARVSRARRRRAAVARRGTAFVPLHVSCPPLGAGARPAFSPSPAGPPTARFLSRARRARPRRAPLSVRRAPSPALVVLVRAPSGDITSVTGRRQLRWIAWGTALGVGPFAFGYALPWALGIDPPLALQLTAVPLGLVPLTFASAIVRYRLRDVEVIIKRGLGVRGVSRRERVPCFWRCASSRGLSSERRRRAQLDRRASGDDGRRAAGAAGEGRGAERARSPVLPRSLRLPPRAGRFRPRSEQRPRRRSPRASGWSHASSRRWSSIGWR